MSDDKNLHLDRIPYDEFVAAIKKPGSDILASLTPEKCDMLHMAIGMAGEAAELLDAVKKHVIYNKPLDMKNVKEELGDMGFFREGFIQIVGLEERDIIKDNKEKLSIRYKGLTYSDKAAQDRADKSNETAT